MKSKEFPDFCKYLNCYNNFFRCLLKHNDRCLLKHNEIYICSGKYLRDSSTCRFISRLGIPYIDTDIEPIIIASAFIKYVQQIDRKTKENN